MRLVTPESGLLRAVTDLLTFERVWWMRCNTGTHVLDGADGKRRVFRAGRPGMADLLALPTPWCCIVCRRRQAWAGRSKCHDVLSVQMFTPAWIELKSASGHQSSAQKAFQAEVEREGMAYLLVRDVDEVVRFLKGKA